MATISLRVSEEEEKIMRDYAKANNLSMSELVRSTLLERIEDDIDLQLYQEAKAEHEEDPCDISFDEMLDELDDTKK